MKIRIIALITFFLIIFALFYHSCTNQSQDMHESALFIDKNGSWFCDFSVSGNRVQFRCHLCLVNETNETQIVYVLGNFDEDVKGKLVLEENILASHQEEPDNAKFSLRPGMNVFDVVFVGTYGGTQQKSDRLLPDIAIIKYFEADS